MKTWSGHVESWMWFDQQAIQLCGVVLNETFRREEEQMSIGMTNEEGHFSLVHNLRGTLYEHTSW